MKKPNLTRRRVVPILVAGALIGGLAAGRHLFASDHQDTPEVELSPRFDVNDVYAFPAPTPGRTVLVLGTSSPLTPAKTASFTFGTKDQELYQLKIDNNGDAKEDLVFQFTFTGTSGHQRVTMHGPARPNEVGTANTILGGRKTLAGPTNTVLGSESGIQLFTGPRDDPFFIDLDAFFRVLPDRKPSAGPLSQITQGPLTFRPAGQAVDFVRGFNDMAIVVELPTSMLVADPQHPSKFGVWGTTSRARGN